MRVTAQVQRDRGTKAQRDKRRTSNVQHPTSNEKQRSTQEAEGHKVEEPVWCV